ncbi:MAG TPA: hypothetical protein V6C72_08815, partial [Chroococcales cyanobacterium]
FWINADDEGVEDYLKIYTELSKEEIEQTMEEFNQNRAGRAAQKKLAWEVTTLVHGEAAAQEASQHAEELRSASQTATARLTADTLTVKVGDSIIDALYNTGLAGSKSEARQLLADKGVYLNDEQIAREQFEENDFKESENSRVAVLRRGKKLQNTKIVKLVQ